MSPPPKEPRPSQVQPTDLSNARIKQLRHFYAVAKEKSFTRASKRLRVGQPAISRSVAQLEAALGVTLLERGKGRRVELTDVGESVLARCTAAFAEFSTIDAIAVESADEPRGELLVAANEHVAIHLLPAVIAALRREMPQVVPRIFTGPSGMLAPRIAAGAIELGLFFLVGDERGVDSMVLRREPCQLVVKRGLEDDREVLTRFIGSREIDDLSNRGFPTVDYLRARRAETAIMLSCNSLEAHKRFVLEGCGVSILPAFTVARELAEGVLSVVHPEYVFEAELRLVTTPHRRLSRPARRLVEGLR